MEKERKEIIDRMRNHPKWNNLNKNDAKLRFKDKTLNETVYIQTR